MIGAFLNKGAEPATLGFSILLVVLAILSIVLYNPIPILIPIGILFALFILNNPKHLLFLFFLIIPFSIEIQLGSLGTDLPSEPLMWTMLGVTFILLLSRSSQISKDLITHPVSLLFLAQLCWMSISGIFSTEQVVSIKNVLAKMWYVIPFFLLPLILIKEEKDFRKIFKFLAIGLFLAIAYVLANHARFGFSFDMANKVVRPIFRNHVNYAIMMVAFLPYFWYLIRTSKSKLKIVNYGLLLFLLAGIYFSYTRAAQACVILAIGYFGVIKFRMTKIAICVGLILVSFLTLHLSVSNTYLDYAPDFETTVVHKKFDNLLEATTKMQDISTVERFYRWIAGAYMVKEKPLTGYGPGTFYFQYSPHTVRSFQTYVSDNPEKSGIHNNYLMVTVEQGLPGLLIMLLIAIIPLILAENTYHRLQVLSEKMIVLAAATCYFLIDVVLLMNDLLEADKVGPLYYLSAAIIVFYSIKARSKS